MTRPEAIEFLKWLRGQVDICYACHDCITTDKCELQAVIELLEREQDEDDRLDALRFAAWALDKKYPKFVEGVKKAWNENNRRKKRTLDEVIKALTICKNPDINRNCKDCPMPDTQECMGVLMTDALHYLETWKLIVESERKAHKADVPANPPLTWDELCRIDMIGEPVWNWGSRRWMLLIDSANDNTWIELVNHAGGREHWIEHDLRLSPLYRKPVVS